jgi:16S rRNA C967 or C1407 C5-methylase (RsmB/RsmF family)
VNTLRVSVEALRRSLEARGFALEPIAGLPSFLRILEEPCPVSHTLEHWLGLFYLQQAATGAAALALAPAPGERVLDLCAAPGGKAAHVAEQMEGSGLVVAGDNSPGRVRALLGNVYRLGHTCVLGVAADGRTFPDGALFDRVIVDVPCSGEGNPRRRRGSRSSLSVSEGFRGHITGVQRALLRRAVELVRPGGRVLYVTCTSAVEENEAVVARALGRLPVSVEPIGLDLPHDPGVTEVGGRSLPEEVAHTWRIGPQHLGSGNLFMACLRREEDAPRESLRARGEENGWSPVPRLFQEGSAGAQIPESHLEGALEEIQLAMGVPARVLERTRWMIRGESVWMHDVAAWPMDVWLEGPEPGQPADWRWLSLGVRAFRQESSGRLRPTNDLLRLLDGDLRERVVELDREEALHVLERGESSTSGVPDGYVALRLGGRVVGRGFVRAGRLRAEIPRPQAALLRESLRASG